MAEITVRFYTLLRQMLETDRIYLEAGDLEEAVEQLEREFGSRLREQLARFGIGQNSKMLDYCVLLLNGQSVNRQELGRIKLVTGDILHVFPPAAGG
jgi:molybdopterin converting factor small subunit